MAEKKVMRSFAEQLLDVAIELSPSGDIGSLYASRFEDTLEGLVDKGEIVGWRASEQYSIEDGEGKDYFVETLDGEEVPFSITSTRRKVQYRKKKMPHTTVAIRVRDKRLLKPVISLEGEVMKKVGKYLSSKEETGG